MKYNTYNFTSPLIQSSPDASKGSIANFLNYFVPGQAIIEIIRARLGNLTFQLKDGKKDLQRYIEVLFLQL